MNKISTDPRVLTYKHILVNLNLIKYFAPSFLNSRNSKSAVFQEKHIKVTLF